jgi:hypothetical protein
MYGRWSSLVFLDFVQGAHQEERISPVEIKVGDETPGDSL